MKAAALLPLIAATAALADSSPYDTARKSIENRTAAERRAAAGHADRRVWDNGLWADRTAKTVTLLAAATTLKPSDPAEFFVTPYASGKDYESLTVCFAKPADVQAAMRFIGLEPGSPIDPQANRFWARGPRVVMRFKPGDRPPVRAESLVLDTATGRPLPDAGLIYTGSTPYAADGQVRRVADDGDGSPIAPTYNDPSALFDVAGQAPQGAVYGRRKPSPAFDARSGDLVEISITPAVGTDAVADCDLDVSVTPGRSGPLLTLHASDHGSGKPIGPAAVAEDLPHAVATLATLADGRRDLYTEVRVDPTVTVVDARKVFAVLRAVEHDRGVKFLPPPGDSLFAAAYFPDPAWRDRSIRLGEPWELFLTRDADGHIAGRLERQTDDPDATPRVRVQTTQPADPAAMAAYVQANASKWSRALFVYPPADLTYGELIDWTKPVTASLPRVFVFPPELPTTRPAPAPSAGMGGVRAYR